MRAVLFDLDGTLVDSERHNAEAVTRVCAGLGRTLSKEERDYVVGHGWREIYAFLSARGQVPLSFEEIVAASARERGRLVETEGLSILPGAVEAVRRVTGTYKSAVVSGSSREEIETTLKQLGVLGCFGFFVGAEDTARGKPSPDGYLQASEKLAVDPRDCVVIEESAAGIAAARAAKMPCVAVRAGNFANQDQSGAHVIIDALTGLDDEVIAMAHRKANA